MTTSNVQTAPDRSQPVKRKRLTLRLISSLFDLIGYLLLAWMLSVAIEFICMYFFWPDEGSAHSERMLQQELGYLHQNFETSILTLSPGVIAFDVALLTKYYLFEWMHLISFNDWLKAPPVDAGNMRRSIARVAWITNDYFQAFINTTLIFSVRITVAVLSLTGFLLIGGAAFVDGLVHRELRIYGGGIERSIVFHHAKRWIKPAIFSSCFIYFGIPFSIHPNWIFVPAFGVFGLAVFITAALYKKHI